MALYNIPFSLPGRKGGVPFSISKMHHKNQAAQGLKFQGPKHSKHFIWVECSNSFLLVKMTFFLLAMLIYSRFLGAMDALTSRGLKATVEQFWL